jgi:hypothetical protein
MGTQDVPIDVRSLCDGGEVGSECSLELLGDVAFQASDDFFLGSLLGESPFHVALHFGTVSESEDDDHVECPVGLPVPWVVESMSARSPRRR